MAAKRRKQNTKRGTAARKIRSLIILFLIPPLLAVTLFYPDEIFLLVFMVCLAAGAREIWNFLPLKAQRLYGTRRKFIWIAVLCASFFAFTSSIINYYFLPHINRPESVMSLLVILFFTCILAWRLTIRRNGQIITLLLVLAAIHLAVIRFQDVQFSQEPPLSPAGKDQNPVVDNLRSLPYAAWVQDEENIDKSWVTRYVPEKAHDGWNLFACDYSPNVYLIDMAGNLMRSWSNKNHYWQYVERYKGRLYGIVQDKVLVKFSWLGNVIWKRKMRFHHDLDFDREGNIYALTKQCRVYWKNGLPIPILNDYVTILSADGRVKKNLSLLEIVSEAIPPDRLEWKALWNEFNNLMRENPVKMISQKLILTHHYGGHDLLHTNTVEIVRREIDGFCRRGDLLVCMRNLDLIGIIDPGNGKIRWSWGPGVLERPHQPSLLQNGNILLFDNGTVRKYSRIIEMKPLTGKIVWEYKADPPEDFYSSGRGGVQRLPNGNTLITDSNKGRVFEVTRDHEIVWELFSPEVKRQDKVRKPIYRLTRVKPTKSVSGGGTM